MKNFNSIDFKGRLFDYTLEERTGDYGVAIAGELTIEVDADGTLANARFFAKPKFNSGKANSTYAVLDAMMSGEYQTVKENGEAADWIAITGSVDVNYFVSKQSNDGEIARAQKVRGGFIKPNREKRYANKWKTDLLVTSITDVEADVERGLDRFLRVKGFIVDDYNKRLAEIQVQVRAEKAINYIAGLEASIAQPYFVSTWGALMQVKRLVVTKNAFGEDEENEFSNIQWVVTGMNPEAYIFGDESAITNEDYETFRANLSAFIDAIKEKESEGTGAEDLPF